MFLGLMNNKTAPIHSIAVALLAVAVIFLAIKEPRCDCDNDMPSAQTTTGQQDSMQRPSRTGRQRELRKF
tara:strand:+ start:283 stop:492 length:210 start_codon:yes stop_codon:yes gene_type:complete